MNFFPGIFLAASALSATTAGGAILAGRLTSRRAAKAREAEFQALFAADPNDPAQEVELLLADSSRRMAWYRPPLGWIDADALTPIDRRDVVGWREPPFAKDADDDPADWSIECCTRSSNGGFRAGCPKAE